MTKPRSRTIRLLLGFVIVSSCLGCDQVTKRIATQSLRNLPPQSYLADTIHLEYALNPGGFMSLGRNLPESFRQWLFIGFSSATMLVVAGLLIFRRHMPWPLFVALSFCLAGGIGNLIDRVSNNGLVTDFIVLGIGPVHTGIFNVADVAVTFGGIAAVLLWQREKPETPAAQSTSPLES